MMNPHIIAITDGGLGLLLQSLHDVQMSRTRPSVDLSLRPQQVFSITRFTGLRGERPHVNAEGERYIGDEIERD